jgi:hypothetical protein
MEVRLKKKEEDLEWVELIKNWHAICNKQK